MKSQDNIVSLTLLDIIIIVTFPINFLMGVTLIANFITNERDYSRICFCSTFEQRIAICIRMWTHGCHKMMTENSKTTNFRAHFLYNTSV